MSWLFSRVLVEEYLGDISSDGEQSVQLNGNPTQLAYCAPDKMTDFSRLSRFGMTYKPLTESRGEELLTLYLGAFHAKTSQLPEREQGLTENGQECGEKWRASFTKYDPDSSSWKTHQCSLLGDLDEFSETWPKWGLMRSGECWEQTQLEPLTDETESGLPDGETFFHTPNTSGLDGGSNSRKALKKRQMWPTPIASRGGAWRADGQVSMVARNVDTYEEYWALTQGTSKKKREKYWPTPCSTDHKGSGKTRALRDRLDYAAERGETKSNQYTEIMGAGGKLNPTWVEWLMGWPLGWTDLKPLETDKFQRWLDAHGKS